MQISFGTHAHMSIYEIEAVLRDYLLREKGFTVESIDHEIVRQTCGMGAYERECHNLKGMVFRGVSKDLPPLSELTTGKRSSLASQISDIESGNVVER